MKEYRVAEDVFFCKKLMGMIGHPGMDACFRIAREVSVNFRLIKEGGDLYELCIAMMPHEEAMTEPGVGVVIDLRMVEFLAFCEEEAIQDFRLFVRQRYGGTTVEDFQGGGRVELANSGRLESLMWFSLSDGGDGCVIHVSDTCLDEQDSPDDETALRGGIPRPKLTLV